MNKISVSYDFILAKNFIFEYLSDAVEQLIEGKNRSLTKSDVIEYFAE
jgi:hypothetical protein